MENTPLLIAGSIFLAAFFLIISGYSFSAARRKSKEIINRAEKWSAEEKNTATSAGSTPTRKSNGRSAISSLFSKKKPFDHAGIYAATPLAFQQAGLYDPGSVRAFRLFKILLLLVIIVSLGLYVFARHQIFTPIFLLISFILLCLGYLLPTFWLSYRASKRKKGFERSFPDALDLLVVCLEAGMGLDSAIARVAKEMELTSPDLSQEFKILSLELKTGKMRNACLKNLAQRIDIDDVENLVNVLIQAERFGTAIANALRVHAEEMRQKRYARLEEEAAKLPVKLVFPLIFFIFPSLFVVILGPAAISIVKAFADR